MKNYYVSCELEEGTPDYNFVIKAENQDEADEKAFTIILKDYPEYEKNNDSQYNFSVKEITADELLAKMTLN